MHSNNKLLKKIRKKLSAISIIVIRYAGGSLKNSKPCCMCVKFMTLLNIKRIYYTNDTGDLVSERVNHVHTTHVSTMSRNSHNYY